MKCYNCGREVSDSSTVKESEDINVVLKNHREHLPADCFFADASDEEKRNRITVSACFPCNNGFSHIDDEIRNMFGIANDSLDEGEILTDKSVKALIRKPNWKERVVLDENGNIKGINHSLRKARITYIKNFKALFYHEFGFPLKEEQKVLIWYDGFKYYKEEDETIKHIKNIHNFLMTDNIWKISGHEKIFKYKIKSVSFNEQGIITYEPDIKKAKSILMSQVYRKDLEAFLVYYNFDSSSNSTVS